MKRMLLPATLLALIWSCGSEPKEPVKVESTTSDSLPILYDFIETTDPNFCSLDSIEGGDCNGGNLYLAKNGKAVYQFFCYDSENDTLDVSVGDYKIKDGKIICDFKYSLFARIKDSLGNDLGENYLRESKVDNPWKLVLEKSNCKHEYIYKSPYSQEQLKSGYVYGTGLIFSLDTIGVVEKWEKILK